jgi:hypothetical protein
MKTLIAVGNKGKLDNLGVNTLDAYLCKEKRIKNKEEKGFSPFTPLYEADMKFEPIMIKADKQNYAAEVEKVYNSLIASGKYIPGVYGDCLKFVETEEGLLLTEIGPKAFNKPNHASDLGMLILSNDAEQQTFSPFIIRKNEPGKGKAAFAGGFWNKGEGYVDSGLYTILKEASEELNFSCTDDIEKYRNDYNTKEVEVNVKINGKTYKGILKHSGTFKTSDELMKNGGERISEKSKKVRVDMTDLYILKVQTDMNAKDLEKELKIQYKAGDDAAKVMIENITPFVNNNDVKGLNDKLQCGIQHHKDLVEVLIETAQN